MSTSLATGTTHKTATAAPRLWAYTGVLAGLAGVVGIQASMSVSAVYDEDGDAVAILAGLRDFVPNIVVFHVTMMLATVLLVVFAAGLRRRLKAQAPADSLLPDVAAFGLLLTSVAGLIGTGLNTEFAFALADDETEIVPEAAVVFGHWIGTLPWLWVGAGITGTALAAAALRHAAAPRWIGWVAAVLGGLTLLLGISPLQYMAGMTGPVLVLVVAAGFVWGDRRRA
ncbi:hypothetical protein [Jiangella alba]|uniref:DUF4386 family protein n=1 Tax=Jiangella alba TaxID=561176 RepID=A0A1H5HVB7_9ACTN|nr:hypothetical protein [Jiangella alba]SEE31953.1 hypothetical protein SAMN04488561_0977 [Jiangella alba]